MKKKKISKSDRALIQKMKSAMARVESGPKQYYSVNRTKSDKAKTTYAFGLYQFLPSIHFDEMKKFAKEHPEYGIPTENIPTEKEFNTLRSQGKTQEIENALKPFLGNKLFQDKYYENWMVNDVLPQAKKTYEEFGKDVGYSLEQVLALNHIMGPSSARNKLKQAVTNPEVLNDSISELNPDSPNKYTTKFTNEIIRQGGKETNPETFNENGDPDFPSIKKRYNDIRFRNDLDLIQKQEALNNFYSDIKTEGLEDEFINFLDQEEEAINDFKSGKSTGGFIHNMIQHPKAKLKRKANGGYSIFFDGKAKELDELEKGLRENLPEEVYKKIKTNTTFTKGDNVILSLELQGDNLQQLLEIPDKEYRDISGENLYLDVKNDSKGKFVGLSISPKKDLNNVDDRFSKNKIFKERPNFSEVIDKNEEEKQLSGEEPETAKVLFPDIQEKIENAERLIKKEQEQFDKEIGEFNRKASESFGSFIDKEENIVPDTFEYNVDDYNRELPIGALAQGALGLIGLGDAKTELPLRDEQVSEAILNYAKTNKKIAEIGLRPEEEAAMKTQVAEAYQEGMSQLVRASAGNRNLVLGNSSSLNLNRIKGLTNISLTDIQRKDAAYEKYGKTLEYIENFNTNRDIANHGIKLQEAQQKRMAGAQLAASGFAGMIEELQFQKENGPGSANHMLKQQLMYSSFGVVPGMKDDGTGTKVGTASYAKSQAKAIKQNNANIRAENELNTAFRNKVGALSDVEKERLNRTNFFDKVQDPKVRKNWVETGILALPEENQQPLPSPNSEVGPNNLLPESEMKDIINQSQPVYGFGGFLT